MLKTPISTGAALFLSLGIFLSSVSSANAQVLSFPSTMRVPGLTLESPLSLGNDQVKNLSFFSSVHFSLTPTLFLTDQSASNSANLADMVTPAPVDLVPVETTIPDPTIKPSIKPTVKPTVKPTATPTATPDPTTTPAATTQTVSIPANPTGGLNADTLFNMVQSHRAAMNLPAFQVDARACTVAEARAPQVEEEIDNGHMHSGLKAMNLPYWNTENIITMRTEATAFDWWVHDQVHKEAIEGPYKYSCLACSGQACAEEFTDFSPK
jgi:uncharacterized protein YkwD